MKRKFGFYLLCILFSFFIVLGTSSCASSNPYAKGKESHAYKHTKTKQAKWGSTTSLDTTYKIKNKKHKSGSVKK